MTAASPDRGEIWWVCFDPSIGDEIKKSRPAVVISSPALAKLRLRIVVPITGWRSGSSKIPWHYPLKADALTGLEKDSVADALQIKSVSLDRFVKKIGRVSSSWLMGVYTAPQLRDSAYSADFLIL